MEIVKVTLAVLFIVIVLGYIYSLSSKCVEKNGILVRTPFGFTCMEKVK